ALPEAQVDRFMMKVIVGYPSEAEEFVIVDRMTGAVPTASPVMTTEGLIAMQRGADAVFVDPALKSYAVRLATATRHPESYGLSDLQRYITFGASPRASINLVLTARALAFVRGRDYALPEDVIDMALDVLRHRLVLSFEALSDDVSPDALLKAILDRGPAPGVPPPAGGPGPATARAAPAGGGGPRPRA